MSRLTAAQVISLGEYLNPDFDPSSLTVSQLLGILGFHNIKYPSPYTKPKLVQLFTNEVTPRAAKFKKERLKKETSLASDDGILDGITGKPIGIEKVIRVCNAPDMPIKSSIQPPSVRRSSRRLSRAPTEEETHSALSDNVRLSRSSTDSSLITPRAAATTSSLICATNFGWNLQKVCGDRSFACGRR